MTLAILSLTAPSDLFADPRVVTASQVNGTWSSGTGTFKVWALGQQRLKVEFLGFYEFASSMGPTANTGEGSGIAHIEGDTALFKPDEASGEDCAITMRFADKKLLVTQQGICGFGMNVSAEGTYRKKSKAKPKFGAN